MIDTLKELSDALGSDANFSSSVATSLSSEQNKFVLSNIPANAVILFDADSTSFRGIQAKSPLKVDATAGGDAYLTVSLDSTANVSTANLTASGTLTVAGTNVITELGKKHPRQAQHLRVPSQGYPNRRLV